MSDAAAPKKAKGGKFAQRNFKRKAKRDALASGMLPEELEAAGIIGHKKARGPEGDAVHDPNRRNNNGVWKLAPDSGGFMVAIPDCPKFESYYRAQGILEEGEWPAFLDSLRTKLPTTFRISTISGVHASLLHELRTTMQVTPEQNKLGAATSYTYTDPQSRESFVIDPPKPLAWYPNSLGWYIRAGKTELKTRGNMFVKFRSFLMAQNDEGNLNRQEAVSMIPPLLLDVQPEHVVLDMCAAPGSKTAQLLEGLHGGFKEELHDVFRTPSGMVVANDSDTKRAYLLVHQLKRYGSSAFLVTTHDGQHFPNLYKKVPTAEGAEAGAIAAPDAAAAAAAAAPAAAASSVSASAAAAFSTPSGSVDDSAPVLFDRILCDVPCSGDGTLRKNINLWAIWDTKFANGLHSLQVQIACRALELLRVGGLMVYSTCSFNPIENESVVMELCRRCNGNLEIVDVSDRLPGLLRRPGLTTWKVRDTGMDEWATGEEEEIKQGTHKSLKASMFPPTEEEVKRFQPQRCMRVVPHAQDTGGFFIALLRKTGETQGVKNPAAWAKLQAAQAAAAAAAAQSSTGDAAGSVPAPVASPDLAALADAEEQAEAERAQSVLAELPEMDGEGGADAAAALALPAGLDDPQGSKGHKLAVKAKDGAQKKFNEDPFEPMNPEAVAKIIDFYGLSHGVDHTNFFTRSDGQRKCYFVAPGIAALLHCPRNAHKLRIVHTGSRCYERGAKPEDATYPCQYRVVQEGVESVLPFMTRQLMKPRFEDALQVLYRHAWPYKDMRRNVTAAGADGGASSSVGEHEGFFRELIKNKNGCMVFVITGEEVAKHVTAFSNAAQQAAAKAEQAKVAAAAGGDASMSDDVSSSVAIPAATTAAAASCRSIPFCIWKTPHSISLMISAVEQAALLRLLDPLGLFMPPEVRAKKEEKARAEQAKADERNQKQEAYAAKAKEALAATAAAAAAAAAARSSAPTNAAAAPAVTAAAPPAAEAKPEESAAVKPEEAAAASTEAQPMKTE